MSFYKFVTKAFKCFVNIFYKYKVIGAENIPDEGNVIIAANHKSNLDPIFLAAAIENRQVAAIAKKELFEVANAFIKPMREKYFYFMEHKEEVDKILAEGAEKARYIAKKTMAKVRKRIGV